MTSSYTDSELLEAVEREMNANPSYRDQIKASLNAKSRGTLERLIREVAAATFIIILEKVVEMVANRLRGE